MWVNPQTGIPMRAAVEGGIIRRSRYDVERLSPEAALKPEVQRRGYHLLTVGDQYVIVYNPGQLDIIC